MRGLKLQLCKGRIDFAPFAVWHLGLANWAWSLQLPLLERMDLRNERHAVGNQNGVCICAKACLLFFCLTFRYFRYKLVPHK